MKERRDVRKTVCLTRKMAKMVERRAVSENKTISEIILDSCDYYLLQQVEVEDKLGVVSKSLARQRSEIRSLRDDIRIVLFSIEALAKFLFMHIPEISSSSVDSPEWIEIQRILKVRYEKFVDVVVKSVSAGGGILSVLKELESESGIELESELE